MNTGQNHRIALMAVLLAAVTLAVYWPVHRFEFVNYDDDLYVYDNPYVREGLTGNTLRWALTADLVSDSPNADFWAPATFVSHLLVAEFFGLDPSAHHLTNLFLHVLNVLLLFWVLARMTRQPGPSAFAAALFAVHPLHVESVAWVTERKDVLSGLFFLLTLLAYARYAERPGATRYLLVASALALGLMAKPMLVTLPFVLLLLDVWPLGRFRLFSMKRTDVKAGIRLVREKIPLFALAAASAVVTLVGVQREGAIAPLEKLSPVSRVANAVVSYAGYLGKMLWPADLSVFYPHPVDQWPVWMVAGSAILLAGVSIAVFVMRSTRPYLIVGWLWFLGTLLPVIGILQAGLQSMADRYTYIPSIGVFAMVSWGIAGRAGALPRVRRLLPAAATAVIAILTVTARTQVGYWRNSTTLFEHAARAADQNVTVYNNLANAYESAGRLEDAAEQLRRAVRTDPASATAHNNLGIILGRLDRRDEAMEHLKTAVSLDPDYAEAHNSLGSAYRDRGRPDEAVRQFVYAIELNPDYAEAHHNLGLAYQDQGRNGEAEREFRTALGIKPDLAPSHVALADLLRQTGRLDEAGRQYRTALAVAPDDAAAHNGLGETLTDRGLFPEAVAEFQAALKLSSDPVGIYNNLANAYLLSGRTGEAIGAYRSALRLAPEPIIHYNLGLAYLRAGRIREARGAFEEALRIDPVFEEARQALRNLPD